MLMLLEAQVNPKTTLGLTPLHYAAWYGHAAVSTQGLYFLRLQSRGRFLKKLGPDMTKNLAFTRVV
jgi:ankyrin repeat protein